MPGGRRFPRHLHLGSEQATVLAGGYEDERGSFEAGDYVEYERGSEHGPDTLDGDPCWILFRLEGKVRFRGWRGLIQRLVP
jgi:putative transcriptional regulator